MRKPPFPIMAMLMAAAVPLIAQQPEPTQGPTALTIIVDTSWSTENEMPELRTLARQAIASLEVGDYLEILTAHPRRATLRLAQTIKAGDSREAAAITATLARVKSYFLSDAAIANALDVAIKRLETTCAKGHYRQAAVMVFTDGRLTTRDTAKVIGLAVTLRKKNWPLYLTGTRAASKTLLVAANQGKLNWSLIGEANPALWLRELRASTAPEKEPKPSVSPAARENPTVQQSEDRAGQGESVPPDHTSGGATRTLEGESARYSIVTSVDHTVSFSPSGRTTPPTGPSSVPPPTGAGDPNALQSTPTEPLGTVQRGGSTEALEEPNAPEDLSSVPPPAGTEDPNALQSRPMEQLGTVQKGGATEALEEPNAPEGPSPPPSKPKPNRYLLWILLPALALLATVLYVIGRAWQTARRWKLKTRPPRGKTHHSNHQVLVADVNGQTYRLGPVDRLQPIHVGSGRNNAIKVPDASVNSRHLRVYRRRHDLMVRNLAKSPVRINSTELKPGGKRSLTFPSMIDLTDKVRLHLRLISPSQTPQASGRTGHETDK